MRAAERVTISRSSFAFAALCLALWLSWWPAPALAQQAGREELTPCSGSQAQPSQSAAWPVAFCNRTSHDLVIEFRDNDCPAQSWTRRGDIYRRSIRRGDSLIVPLCYAVESRETQAPAPGVPQLRIPGGKGVVTTWTVVGDCGERSDHLYRDSLSFYDRGDFKSGIILLQSPAGAPHCVADASNASRQPSASPMPASAPTQAATTALTGAPAQAGASATPSASTPSRPASSAATAAPSVASAAPGGTAPSLSASIDPHDTWNRTVHVYAISDSNAGNSKCTFLLALSFTDGGSWNDRTHATVPPGASNSEVLTRKYGKSVARVTLNSQKCEPR